MSKFNLLSRTGLTLLVLSSALFSTSSFALSCKKNGTEVSQTIALTDQINV